MWNELEQENKKQYKKMILAFASLTELFTQKSKQNGCIPVPAINSKYQETIFQRVFHARSEDISNTPFDASLVNGNTTYLIGIKTFHKSGIGFQKVAQFKGVHEDWIRECYRENDDDLKKWCCEIAEKIRKLRNDRMSSQKERILGPGNSCQGESKCVYHFLMPYVKGNVPYIKVGETKYDEIGKIKNVKPLKKGLGFCFEDEFHQYKYTDADCQLWMNFKNGYVDEDWTVEYADDAYKLIEKLAENVNSKPLDVVESYCWKINIQKYSGFNNCFSTSSKDYKSRNRQKKAVLDQLKSVRNKEIREELTSKIQQFCQKAKSDSDRDEQSKVRDEIETLLKRVSNKGLVESIRKILWSRKDEVYIPIPRAAEFHRQHGNFFVEGADKLYKRTNELSKKEFKLVLEPSGVEVSCHLTQSQGKGIQSVGDQGKLGKWILHGIFQLKEHEQLTERRLAEIGVNGIKFIKTSDNKIHCCFVSIDPEEEETNQTIWPTACNNDTL